MPEKRQRILIVKMSSLGDLFHALPTIHSLKSNSEADIDWVVNRQYAETVSCFAEVDDVIEFPRQNLFGGQRRFLRALRRERYDLVVDLQGLLKSAYVARMARAERRIAPSFSRECAHLCYREVAGEKDKDRHAVEECLDVVRYLGLSIDTSAPPINFPAYKDAVPNPAIAFAPVSRWKTKDWPPEHFIEAGRRIQNECYAAIYVVGTRDDWEQCEMIASGIGGKAVNIAGETSIAELGGLLQEVDLLISVDSGPVHIAAAVQTPVLGLYGITDPLRTGPYGDMHRTIRAPLPAKRHGDFRKPTPANLAMMESIQPRIVVETALAMIEDRH